MARIFIYGSCVTRDAFDENADDLEVVGYVARQSIISAMALREGPAIDSGTLTSQFQQGMVDGDSAGNLRETIAEVSAFIDVILWDITDERMGVLAFDGDRFLTPLNELRATEDDILSNGESVLFGTDRHFDLFRRATQIFSQWLTSRMMLEKVTVIATPHSSVLDGGSSNADFEDLAERARRWNEQAHRYYELLSMQGFRVEHVDIEDVVIDPEHRWGIAPFHFAQKTYTAMRALVRRVALDDSDTSKSSLAVFDSSVDFESRLKGLWPNGLDVTAINDGWCIKLPNGQNVEIPDSSGSVDWDMRFDSDHATSSLWLRSLIYLPLLDHLGAKELVDRLVSSFAKFLTKMVQDQEFYRTNSLDHTISLAMYSLSRVRFQRAQDGITVSGEQLAEWTELLVVLERLARSPKVYRDNNHGMFLFVSLLLCHLIWPDVPRVNGVLDSDVNRMMRLLEQGFTSEGVTVENTPHYQEIWIRLVDQARYLAFKLNISNMLPSLDALHRKISEAFQIMLLPDGNIPPFGDGMRAMAADPRRKDGTLYSPDSGVFIYKCDRDYFGFKCGYASNVHKHLDDTSIFLMVEGVELLADLGLVNYDNFDMQASLRRGQLGHSMIAFPDFDYVSQSFVYPADSESGASWNMTRTELDGVIRVTGRGTIAPGYYCERSVTFYSPRELLIRDSARSSFAGKAVQRFIIPEGAVCSVSEGDVLVLHGGLTMRLRFETAVDESLVHIDNSSVSTYQVLERSIVADGSVCTVSIVVSVADEQE